MNLKIVSDRSKKFSIVFFLQGAEVSTKRKELEMLGGLEHVKLVVQPCPYEGIEFLYRVPIDLPAQHVSADREFFWHLLELKGTTTQAQIEKISEHHYGFLVGILEQDAGKVSRERQKLEALIQKWGAAPSQS